jgi:integrase
MRGGADSCSGNVKYAANLVVRINQRIGDGTFDYAEFFPDSPRAGKARGAHTFGEMCDLWFDTKGRLATKTKRQLRGSAAVDKSNVASVKAMMPFA